MDSPVHAAEDTSSMDADAEFCAVGGESYLTMLERLHTHLRPATYLEIGTETGKTLALASCSSICIDPRFRIEGNVIGGKPACMFFQTESDRFFRQHDPAQLLGASIDFAFLDGMHLFEYVLRDFINTERHCRPNSLIALHDCLPADRYMAERIRNPAVAQKSRRPRWWTGDVWKMIPTLKKYRSDLEITVVDAEPTGLVLVTNLDSTSDVLEKNYARIVRELTYVDIGAYGIRRFHGECGLTSTSKLATAADISRFYWF